MPIAPSLGEPPSLADPGTPADRRPPSRWLLSTWRAALASLLLHVTAVLLLAWWVDDRDPGSSPERSIVTVTLEAFEPAEPSLEPRAEPETLDPPAAAEPTVPPVTEAPALRDPAAEAAVEPPVEAPASEPPAADRADVPAPTVDLQQLRQQLSTLSLPDEDDGIEGAAPAFDAPPTTTVPWARSGAPIRGLPLGGGWMNPWVGPVEAYSETWGSVVGEQRGVHVLPNGQVICTRVDAPTNDELMNPWMSMRVTYMRLCGKERGTAPPSDDLRYAPPPPALRRTID